MSDTFKAIMINQDDDKKQSVEVKDISESELMEGDVTVEVEATTVNYKDGLAITGKAPVVRKWPMIPGIDFAGKVVDSQNSEFKVGDEVILNGWGVGETHFGGYAQKARVNGDWLIHKPSGMTAKQAMAIGTAGYTAMLCVIALENHNITPDRGKVIVTGANGGVGSVAVSVLSKLGYEVIAATRRTQEEKFLKELGASEILDAKELSEAGGPLGKEQWIAGIDAVGSHTLANLLAQTKYGGCIAACGLAQGFDLPTSVMPFILRGVCLLGVDSVMAPKSIRKEAYERLAQDLDMKKLENLSCEIGFDNLIQSANDIVEGKIRGRVVAVY